MDETQSIAETIEEFLATLAADSKDRRASRRAAYRVVQAVAPYDGTSFPAGDKFRQVQCHDLSRGGMSFIWPHVPVFERVVIKIATPDRPLGLVARVAGCRPLGKANREFRVGCEFLDRVHISG